LLIREDAHTLYGFFDQAEKSMFLHLLGVSGVGAPTARMILSAMKPEEVQEAILQENEKLLESIKGIGAKTAKRIILELKDKMVKYGMNVPGQIDGEQKVRNTLHTDALNALLALGIARPAADAAIRKATKSLQADSSLEVLIKEALKNL
jgi:Holliday junction DNA helicase RuvA